jgi:hypothetical protein
MPNRVFSVNEKLLYAVYFLRRAAMIGMAAGGRRHPEPYAPQCHVLGCHLASTSGNEPEAL